MKKKMALVLLLVLLVAETAQATSSVTGAINAGIGVAATDLETFGRGIGNILGPVVTAYGGTKASIKAALHQEWVTPLLWAVIGAGLIAVFS